MKRFFLPAAIMAFAAITASAQWVPNPGTINLNDCPAGLSSVDYNKTSEINRKAKGFITLEVDGEVVKKIPASNSELLYCINGFTKGDILGYPHITFWNGQMQTSPYQYNGNYKVTVPAGFFKTTTYKEETGADGITTSVPTTSYNEVLTAEWTINSNARMEITPANGSTIEKFTTFSITFPGATSIQARNTENNKSSTAVYLEFTPDSSTEVEPITSTGLTCTVNGNVATYNLPAEYQFSEPGKILIQIGASAFQITDAQGNKSTNALTSVNYTIGNNQSSATNGWTITPAPGEYADFVSTEVAGTKTEDTTGLGGYITPGHPAYWAFFTIHAPEDVTVKMLLPAAPKLYPVVDGVVDKNNGISMRVTMLPDKSGLYVRDSDDDHNYKESHLVLAPGEWVLNIPADKIRLADNSYAPELNFNYTITGTDVKIDYTLSPSNEAVVTEPINKIVVTFPSAASISWDKTAYVRYAYDGIDYVARAEVNPEAANELIINLNAPLEEKGEYHFTCGASALKVDGINFALDFTYNVDAENTTAVEAIEAAGAEKVVYTIEGLRVNEDTLAPGLYIINGKKVIVK